MSSDAWLAVLAAVVATLTTWYSSGGQGAVARRRIHQELEIREAVENRDLRAVLTRQIEGRLALYLDASAPPRYLDRWRELLPGAIKLSIVGAVGVGLVGLAELLPAGPAWDLVRLGAGALSLGTILAMLWFGFTILVRSHVHSRLANSEFRMREAHRRLIDELDRR